MAKTLQHAFNVVYRHLLKQGRRSTRALDDNERADLYAQGGDTPPCVYRAADGCKCAIGILIPDALYRPALEGEAAASRAVVDVLGEAHWPTGDKARSLYSALQHVHDRVEPAEWSQALARVATDFDLRVPTA